LSTAIIIKNYNSYKAYLLLGCILGFSFLFRYQIAFAFLGIVLWLIFIRKELISKVGATLFSFLIVVLIGFFIDSWYYGEWTITILNYFTVNIIEGKAAQFGTSPWYYYFFLIFNYSIFPIGAIILISFITVGITKYKNIIPWIIIPFFVGHSLVSHKELRFLFPLVNFIPIIIIMSFDYFSMKKWNTLSKNNVKIFFFIIFSMNAIGFIYINIKPAGEGRTRITEKIHTLNNRKNLNVFFTTSYNPFTHRGLSTNFYKEKNANFFDLNSSTKLNLFNLSNNNTRNILVITINDLQNKKVQMLIDNMMMKEIRKNIPDFLFPLLKKYERRDKILILYSD
jgi:phosphatidylinositol glycan class B